MIYTIKINLAPELDLGKLNAIVEQVKKQLGGVADVNPINLSNVGKSLFTIQQSADKAFDGMVDDITKSRAKVDELTDGIKLVDEQSSKIGDTFTTKLAVFGMAAQGINQIASSLGMLTGSYVELDTAIQRIKTLGGVAKELAPSFKDIALQLSSEIPIASTEIANAIYDALSAGINASEKDIKAFMEGAGKLAVGGAESIGNSVNVLSSLLNAYGLEAKETAKISDELFTTINLGKTTLPELSASLSQVIPTAAAMNLEFKNVGASIAIMTANGIPTNQAMTKLNALLVEMQKPGAALSKILEDTGISAATLGEKIQEGDYAGALQSMKDAFDKAGVSATQAFSSIEAGAAFNVLTKDFEKLNQTLNSFNDSTGTTQSAFDEMSEGIENKMNMIRNAIENTFIRINEVVGPAFSVMVSSAQQLAPVVMSIQGIGAIIPDNAIQNMVGYSTTVVNKLVPGLLTTDVITKKTVISTNALSASNLRAGASQLYASAAAKADALAKGVQAAATKAATLAQSGLNAAFLASPVGWIAAGVAALAGTMYLLYENVEPVRKAFDTGFNFIKSILNSIIEVIGSIGNALIPIGQLIFELWISPFEIMWGVIKSIGSAIGSLVGSFFSISNASSATEGAIKGIQNATQVVKEKIESIVIVVKALRAGFESMVSSAIDIVSKLVKLDFTGAVSAFANAGENAGKAYSDSIAKQLETKEWEKSSEKINKLLSEKPAEIKIQVKGDDIKNAAEKSRLEYEKLQQRANEYSSALGSQITIYDVQKKRLEELEKQLQKVNDPKQKDELLQKYNEEAEIINKNKETLVKGFIEGSKAGLVTEETISKLANSLKISNEEARELVVTEVLKDMAKQGALTEDQIKKISQEHKITEDRVREIYEEQKKVTEETRKTDMAAKGWSEALQDIKKRQQDAKEAMLQARLELNIGKITQEEYNKKIKEGNEKIKQSNQEVIERQKAYNALKKQGLLNIIEYNENEKQTTKEKKSQYQIELDNFNRKNETIKKLNEQRNEELKLSRLKEGIVLSEKELNQEKLIQLKELSNEANRQLMAYNTVYNAAKNQFEIEAKRNKVSEQTRKNYEDAKSKLQELTTAQMKAESNVLEFEAQIRIDADKKDEEIKKIKREIELSEIELKIQANIATETDKLKLQVKNLSEDLNEALEKINIEVDPLEQSKLVNTINKITLEIGKLNEQIIEGEISNKLNKIEDLAVRQREISLFESEKTLKEELKKAGENIALKEKAYLDHIKRKIEIDQQYLNESNKLNDIALRNAQQFMRNFAENMISTQIDPVANAIDKLKAKLDDLDNKKLKEADTKAIEEEEKALIESYKRREISAKEFNDKLSSINKKRQENDIIKEETTSRIVLELQNSIVNSLYAISKNLQEQAGNAAEEMRKKVVANIETLKKEGKLSTASIADIFKGTTEEMTTFAYNSIGSAVAGFGALLAAGEDFGIAFRKGILVNLLRTAEQAILTYIPQIYAAFLSWLGPFGLAAATGAIGVVYAALGVAKSELGRKTGEVDIKGKGTATSDDNVRFLSVGESVLTAKATRAPYSKELYEWQNRTGGSPIEYFTSVNPKPLTNLILQTIRKNDAINQEIFKLVENQKIVDRLKENAVDNFKFAIYNNIIMDNYKDSRSNSFELMQLIEETRNLREEVRKGNYMRKELTKLDLDISVNDKELINRVNQIRYDKVRGR